MLQRVDRGLVRDFCTYCGSREFLRNNWGRGGPGRGRFSVFRSSFYRHASFSLSGSEITCPGVRRKHPVPSWRIPILLWVRWEVPLVLCCSLISCDALECSSGSKNGVVPFSRQFRLIFSSFFFSVVGVGVFLLSQ